MKALGIIGSMRRERNTHRLVAGVLCEMQALLPELDVEIIQVSELDVQPCRVVCSAFCARSNFRCQVEDGAMLVLDKMMAADALVIGTPLYFRAPPAKFQALAERLVSVFYFRESQGGSPAQSPLRGKPCGLVGVAEYSNPHLVLEYLHDFCCVLNMNPVRLETFPYLGMAGQGDVVNDRVFNPLEQSRRLAAALLPLAIKNQAPPA